jgi:hypothetical protein
MKNYLICPHCESQDIHQHGFYEVKTGWRRRWRCKKCEKTFSKSTLTEEELLTKEPSDSNQEKLALTTSQKRAIKKNVREHIKEVFPEKSNTRYSREDIVELLLHICLNNAFLSSGTEQYKDQNTNQETPSKNTLYGRLREVDPEVVLQVLDTICHQLCKQLKQSGAITPPVDVAIDEHDWRFYGDPDSQGVTRTKPDQGTSKAYKFLTICIVSRGLRLTLGVVPLEETTVVPMRDAVITLVKKARKRVNIRFLYADRGFYMAPVIDALKGRVKFFIRARLSKKMQRRYRNHSGATCVGSYTVQRKRGEPYVQTKATLVIGGQTKQSKQDELVAFVTNLTLTEPMGAKLMERYRSRWGIETSYRMIRQFLARTTSRKYQIRIGLFVLAIMLYNFWLYENGRRTHSRWINSARFAGLLQSHRSHGRKDSAAFFLLVLMRQKQKARGE